MAVSMRDIIVSLYWRVVDVSSILYSVSLFTLRTACHCVLEVRSMLFFITGGPALSHAREEAFEEAGPYGRLPHGHGQPRVSCSLEVHCVRMCK